MIINGHLNQLTGEFIVAPSTVVEPNFLDDYYDEESRLTYKWNGNKYINKQFFNNVKYYKNNRNDGVIESTQIYLAKPGQRLIGALNGVEEDSGSLTLNLNNTDVLEFTVDRIVDGQVSSFYDLIGLHYELLLPNYGWFKINEEPVISGDGNTETKSIHAESLEIELQQYDLVDFHINTGSVYSKEYLAVDNTYDYEEYQLFHNQVLFYRDTTELEALTAEFKMLTYSNQTIENIENLWRTKYPNAFYWEPHGDTQIFSSWRITFDDENHMVLDLSKHDDNMGYYTPAEFLDMEIERMKNLSFLWQVLHEHGWKVGFVDPYFDSESEYDDDKIPLKYKVGYFEIDSQDTYSFLTLDAAAYFRCIFLFDTDSRTVNVYNVNNIGYDTNIFLSFNNIQNSIQRDSDRQLTTMFHVSGGEELDFTEVNFGEDWIEDLSYFMTTEHFPQSMIDKYNVWKNYRDGRRDDYIQTSLDGRNKRDEIYDLTYKVPLDGTDEGQWDSMTLEELEEEKAALIALLNGYLATIDALDEDELEAYKLTKDYADYISIKDIILSDPIDALDHVVFSYNNTSNTGGFHFFDSTNNKVVPYVEEIEDPETGETTTNIVTYRLGNIDKAMFKKMLLDGDYIPEVQTETVIDPETGEPVINEETGEEETVITYQPTYNERAAALSYASQKEFLDNYQYDFKKYGASYGAEELTTLLEDLKARYELLEKAGYGTAPENGVSHPHELAMYNLYLKYKQAADECLEVLDERTAELELANEDLDTIIATGLAIKEDVAITNPQFGFTAEELDLLDRYYIHKDYTNENIEYLELDTPEQIVQKEKALLDDALEQLYVESHPQWNWSTSQDNLYLMPEFKDWYNKLHVGNFIRVSMRDDYQVKLRVATIQLNPFFIDPTVEIQFSSMLQYRAKRNDYWNLLNETNGSQKNAISRIQRSASSSDNTVLVDSALVLKLLNNSNFMTGVSNGVIGATGYIIGNNVSDKEINVSKITGDQAAFNELYANTINSNLIVTKTLQAESADIQRLQAGLITSDVVISRVVNADSGAFNSLTADSALVLKLNAGLIEANNVTAEFLESELANINILNANVFTSNSAFIESLVSKTNTTIEDKASTGYFYDLIAGNLTAGDIVAGDLVLTDGMRIVSNNENGGNVLFNGSTLQFLDSSGNVGIQIGYNTEDQSGNLEYPHIVIKDSSGSTLITSTGITQNAVPNNLIVTRMINDGQITKAKLGFALNTNDYGGIDIDQIYDGDDGTWGAQYTLFKSTTEGALTNIQNALGNLSGLNLSGQNSFSVASDGTITPASVLIVATATNGVTIDKWYIDGVQNTSYVSQDKTTMTIPSSFMLNKQSILIRVVATDTTKFATMTVYKVANSINIASDVMEYCTYSSPISLPTNPAPNWSTTKPTISYETAYTQNFTGDGTTKAFTVTHSVSSVTEVKVNNTATTAYSRNGKVFTFTTAPANNAAIVVSYKSLDQTENMQGPNVYIWERHHYTMTDGSDFYSIATCNTIESETSFKVDKTNNSITSKIWEVDVSSAINAYDGSEIASLRERTNTTESNIAGIFTSITDTTTQSVELPDGTFIDSIAYKVHNVEETAEIYSRTIESAVNRLDNLPFGGRNLITVSDIEKELSNNLIVYNITTSGRSKMPDADIVISADVKSSVNNTKLGVYIRNSSALIIGTAQIIEGIGTSYDRYTVEMHIPASAQPYDLVFNGTSTYEANTSATYNVNNVKLEIGSIATEWSAAPEDMYGDISYAKSLVVQTAEKIGWVVLSGTDLSNFTLNSRVAELVGADLVITSPLGANQTRTVISGGKISTDLVKSNNYVAPTGQSHYSTSGSFFDLNNGDIITPNFAVYNSNNGSTAYFNGDVYATSLTLGGGSTISGLDVSDLTDADGLIPSDISDLTDTGGIIPTNVLHTSDITISSLTTSGGLTTRTITVGLGANAQYFTEIEAGDFVLTNMPYSNRNDNVDDMTNSTNYVKISSDGLLRAKNALIYGTIYASNGEFTGEVTATSGHIGSYSITNDGVLIGTNVIGLQGSYVDENNETYVSDTIAETGINCSSDPFLDDTYYNNYAYWLATGYKVDDLDLLLITDVPWYVDFDGTMVAKKAIIGDQDKAYLTISDGMVKLYYGNELTPYAQFGDLRGSNSILTKELTFTGNGTKDYFILNYRAIIINSLTIDGVAYNSYNHSSGDKYIYFSTPPANGASIVVNYTTLDEVRIYTFGVRDEEGAMGLYSFCEGYNNIAAGDYSHAEGYETKAGAAYSHAEGDSCIASGVGGHAEGYGTKAAGQHSHAEGSESYANSANSHAEGRSTRANGNNSHAEGFESVASGAYSHAEGRSTASDNYAHSEGNHAVASKDAAHALGYYTVASGNYSHAEGYRTTASGSSSHALGRNSIANGSASFTSGNYTIATETCQTVIGKYNSATVSGTGEDEDPYVYTDVGDYAFIIGNGTANTTADRSNALTVDWAGNLEAAGRVVAKTGASRISCDMATGLSGSTYLIYDTVTQTVRVYGVFAASSSQQASVALATIPSGYRPTSDTYIAGTVTNGSNVTASTAYTIRSDGTIKQNNTNAAMSGMFVGEYAI